MRTNIRTAGAITRVKRNVKRNKNHGTYYGRLCLAIIFLAVGFSFSESAAQCVTPPSGLVSWWPGDGNANDIQNSIHGMLQNGTTFTVGKVGQAFSLDGVDDFVNISNNSNLNVVDKFTVDAWIFPTVGGYNNHIFSHGLSCSSPRSWEIDFGDVPPFIEKLIFDYSLDGTSANTVYSTGTVLLNQWTHIAVSFDNGQVTFYINGQQSGSQNIGGSLFSNTKDIRIGGGQCLVTDALSRPFTGLIDEVDFFNRALSASEIQSIYNAGSAGKCKECTPPEVSITGNDPIFAGTTHTYTATTDAANPSFEWSVSGGMINGDNSNSSVSITADAAGTMMVSVIVTDGVTNCSKEETKNVTVNPLPAGSEEVVFATNSVWLKEHANVLSGNVVVNNASSGPVLDSQVELSVGQSVTTPAGFALKANRIKVKQGAVVASDVFFNELTNNGTINGLQNSPLELPVFASLPTFKQAPAGTPDITVNKDESITLTAGVYRDVLVKQNGTILFAGGGTFAIRSLNTGAKAKLLFDAPTEILIEGKLDTDENSYVGPQDGSGIDAAEIVFYIAGSNGNNGNFGATPKAAQLGLKNTVLANFYVPNGTLSLRQGTVATGAFLGRDVIVGENVQVTLESAFGGSNSLAKSAPDAFEKEKLADTELAAIPQEFELDQNYPNPFNPSTTIYFGLPNTSEVRLAIYNLRGQLVRTLVSGTMVAGRHRVVWDGADANGARVASGIYVYRMQTEGFVASRKLVLTK